MIILCVAIGAFAGIFVPEYLERTPPSHGTPIALAILIGYAVASFFLAIILHEGGHLLFGIVTGYRFSSFRIGSFMLIRTKGKLSFKLHSVAGTGGQCLLSPPDIKNGRLPHALYNLGGVMSNLFFAALSVLFAYITFDYIYITALFFCLATLNLAFAVLNGIPVSTASIDNDGKNALSLGKNPDALHAFWLQLKINAAEADGVRLKDMPEQWFILPDERLADNSLVASKFVFYENRLMDMGDFDGAAEIIEKCKGLPALPDLYKSLLALDEITVKALQGEDYATIASLFTKSVHTVMNSMRTFPAVIRTKYVFAMLVEHNPEGAARAHALFEKTAKTYPYTPDIESEREIMEYADSCVLSE